VSPKVLDCELLKHRVHTRPPESQAQARKPGKHDKIPAVERAMHFPRLGLENTVINIYAACKRNFLEPSNRTPWNRQVYCSFARGTISGSSNGALYMQYPTVEFLFLFEVRVWLTSCLLLTSCLYLFNTDRLMYGKPSKRYKQAYYLTRMTSPYLTCPSCSATSRSHFEFRGINFNQRCCLLTSTRACSNSK
jgi:hypothetical protein